MELPESMTVEGVVYLKWQRIMYSMLYIYKDLPATLFLSRLIIIMDKVDYRKRYHLLITVKPLITDSPKSGQPPYTADKLVAPD